MTLGTHNPTPLQQLQFYLAVFFYYIEYRGGVLRTRKATTYYQEYMK